MFSTKLFHQLEFAFFSNSLYCSSVPELNYTIGDLKLQIRKALNKIQFITTLNHLHVSALGCHPKGFFQITGLQSQHATIGMYHPHWND